MYRMINQTPPGAILGPGKHWAGGRTSLGADDVYGWSASPAGGGLITSGGGRLQLVPGLTGGTRGPGHGVATTPSPNTGVESKQPAPPPTLPGPPSVPGPGPSVPAPGPPSVPAPGPGSTLPPLPPGGVVDEAPLPPGGVLPEEPPPSTPGPSTPSPSSPSGYLASMKAWWQGRSQLEKGAIVVGGAAVTGLLVYAMVGGSQAMTPNLSSGERQRLQDARPGSSVKVGNKRYAVGKIITVKGGRRFGHKVPPKKYRDAGARSKSDYAWGPGYKYPLVFRRSDGSVKVGLTRKRIRAAASYFGRNKHLYPKPVRAQIAKNINRAKARYGIGGKPATA